MAAVPALSLEILLPHLSEVSIPRTFCKILRKDPIFQKIEFRCQQIADVRDIAESQNHRIATQYSTVDQCVGEGIRIECPRSRVKSALEHGLDRKEHRRKHTDLEQDRE
jgi:hypothetical protein